MKRGELLEAFVGNNMVISSQACHCFLVELWWEGSETILYGVLQRLVGGSASHPRPAILERMKI